MTKSQKFLSDLVSYTKYAKFLGDRRESYPETVMRNSSMHVGRYPNLEQEIYSVYSSYVLSRKVLPSMRSMQFSGKPIELNPSRMFNCAYLPIDDYRAFSEIMFLLLGGTGVGYSVQFRHVGQLPSIKVPHGEVRYLIQDSTIGWADAIKRLFKAYLIGAPLPRFDFRDIRPKGRLLITSGGRAPGPEPLERALTNIERILKRKSAGDKLRPIEVFDIVGHLCDAVLSGGIRRSATIALFDVSDIEMLHSKTGDWWETNPQRARANISAVLDRRKLDRKTFDEIFDTLELSGSGEPGFFLTNDPDWGTNPCLPAHAPIITKKGLQTLGDIEEGTEIWSKEGWTKVTKKWQTGQKPVYQYRTSAGSFIGTANHRVVSEGIKVEVGEAESLDIISGPDLYTDDTMFDPSDVMDGLVVADGSVHKASNNLVHLYIGKNDQSYFTSEIKDLIEKHRPGIKETAYEIRTTIKPEELPMTFDRYVPDRFKQHPWKIMGFLRGLYSGNGSVVNNRVVLKATSPQIRDDVQLMLSSIGIRSYFTTNEEHDVKFGNGLYTCKESYDINITSDRYLFLVKVGFIQEYKRDKIKGGTQTGKKNYTITDTKYVGHFDVYDITVDNRTHTFWSGGCDVSNCGEVALRSFGMCNLTELSIGDDISNQEFFDRCRAASFIGTLQAGYTDFHYLRPIWRERAVADALLGVSLTGIASGQYTKLDLAHGAQVAQEENERVADKIGIRPAKRITTVKPSGTAALVLGTSSGVHPYWSRWQVRNIEVAEVEPLYNYLAEYAPEWLFPKRGESGTFLFRVPLENPEDGAYRTESALDALRRIKHVQRNWISPGHVSGLNQHNVSATVSVRSNEWPEVREWLWENKDDYTGLTLFPYWGGTHSEAPNMEILEEEYKEMEAKFPSLNLKDIKEDLDHTDLVGELACAGGNCEI